MNTVLSNQPRSQSSASAYATLVYALQALSFFTVIPFFAGVVINYIKRDDVRGTIADSHFSWQIKTFWYGLLWTVVGSVLSVVLIGYFILALNFIWLIYRVVRGWLKLVDKRPMYI
ncbi:DUF4870 family protein [Algicola sagamiensis]|uniref:DUF4870 family protein n=1 Tax=Algicola sagamiensis TaxID=163869 RepID=UPI00036D8865|nr:hypothetical protein [Algicola sagamiensis]